MKSKLSFWPAGIVLMLVGFFCGIVTLVGIASSSRTDLVSENYYEQEIRYQQRIDGLARAREAGAALTYDQAKARLTLSVSNGPASDAPAQVKLYRPSAAKDDREMTFARQADGVQTVDLTELQPGPWKAKASWVAGGREYLLESSFTNRVRLVERR